MAAGWTAHTSNVLILGDSFVSRLEGSVAHEYGRSSASKIMSINEFSRNALKCHYEVNRVYYQGTPGSGLTDVDVDVDVEDETLELISYRRCGWVFPQFPLDVSSLSVG